MRCALNRFTLRPMEYTNGYMDSDHPLYLDYIWCCKCKQNVVCPAYIEIVGKNRTVGDATCKKCRENTKRICKECRKEIEIEQPLDYEKCLECLPPTRESSPHGQESNTTTIPSDPLDVHQATSQGATSEVSESLCFGEAQNSQEQSQDNRSYSVPCSNRRKRESQDPCEICGELKPCHAQACKNCR
jgi:hypothetical protein